MDTKKIILLAIALIIIISPMNNTLAAPNDLSVQINGKDKIVREIPLLINDKPNYTNVPSFLDNGKTYVSLAGVDKLLKTSSTINGDDIVIKKEETTIKLKIGNNVAYVNGFMKDLGESPLKVKFDYYKDEQIMIPFKTISDLLGYDAGWDVNHKTCYINTKNRTPNEDKYDNYIESVSTFKQITSIPKIKIKLGKSATVEEVVKDKKIILKFKKTGIKNNIGYIPVNEAPVNNIEVKNDGENSLLEIDLKNKISHKVTRENDGKDIIISFENTINKLTKGKYDGKDALIIDGDIVADMEFLRLSNPKRLVFDFRESLLSKNVINLDNRIGYIKSVRVSQYTGKEYPKYEKVVRVVLDIDENADDKTLEIIKEAGKMVIIPKEQIKEPSNKKKIFIDPGHGGHDSGAVNGSIYEKNIILPVALKVRNALIQKGYDVVMSRSSDIYKTLDERTSMANAENADLFVSIHVNSFEKPSGNGVETLYHPNRKGSKSLATSIQNEVMKELVKKDKELNKKEFRDRGIKERPNLYVLNHTKMPAALIEMGFISNPTDLSKITTDGYQDVFARAIVKGIENYINSVY